MILGYVKAFLVGAVLCMIGQILIDKTKLTPARILTLYVVAGVVLGAVGVYGPFAKWAGAGATVPLTGFGNLLAKGVRDAVAEKGVLGAFTGGVTAAAGGIYAAPTEQLLSEAGVRGNTRLKSGGRPDGVKNGQ